MAARHLYDRGERQASEWGPLFVGLCGGSEFHLGPSGFPHPDAPTMTYATATCPTGFHPRMDDGRAAAMAHRIFIERFRARFETLLKSRSERGNAFAYVKVLMKNVRTGWFSKSNVGGVSPRLDGGVASKSV